MQFSLRWVLIHCLILCILCNFDVPPPSSPPRKALSLTTLTALWFWWVRKWVWFGFTLLPDITVGCSKLSVTIFADCCAICCQTAVLRTNFGFSGQSSCAFFCGFKKMCRRQDSHRQKAVIVSLRRIVISVSMQESLTMMSQQCVLVFQFFSLLLECLCWLWVS